MSDETTGSVIKNNIGVISTGAIGLGMASVLIFIYQELSSIKSSIVLGEESRRSIIIEVSRQNEAINRVDNISLDRLEDRMRALEIQFARYSNILQNWRQTDERRRSQEADPSETYHK